MEQFVEVCRRRLKLNAGGSKMITMNGGEGLEYKVHIGRIHLQMGQNVVGKW